MKKAVKAFKRYYLSPQTGHAFSVQEGQIIRVIDVAGGQVADLVCFARRDIEEYLSSGRTIDYNEKLFLSTGDSREMFRLTYGKTKPHPNCLDNLSAALGQYGVRGFQIPTAFNIFMNVEVSTSGEVAVKPPLSKAGDFIDLRSEMDLIIGVTACAAGKCNNYRCTPITVEVYDTRPFAKITGRS